MPRSTISQAQIARTLGMSQATVSHVLNNSGRINPRTRQRVRRLIERLNYRPNAQARSLREGSTRLVGVACGTPTDSYQAQLIEALERELHGQGYQMLLHAILGDAAQAWDRAMEFVDHRACGIIFQTPCPELIDHMERRFPDLFAMVTIGPGKAGTASVSCDYAHAAAAVAQHLLALGRKRWATNVTAAQVTANVRPKTAAFTRAALDAGLPRPVEVSLGGEYFESHLTQHGEAVAEAVMPRHPDVDAFFFSCDDIALGAMAWLKRAGLRVPRDVAVVGFNDSPLASLADPPLTTVRQPPGEFARAAVEMLVAQLRGNASDSAAPSKPRLIPCELIVRGSTDPSYRPPLPDSPPAKVVFVEDQPAPTRSRR